MGCGAEGQDGSALSIPARQGSGGLRSGERKEIVGNIGVRNRQREGPRGLSWPQARGGHRPGQDTHLSVPRLLLRKRRAIRRTSSVRRQAAWSVSLPREGSRRQSCLLPGARARARSRGPSTAWRARAAGPTRSPALPSAPAPGTHTSQCSPRNISSCPAHSARASRRAW